MNIKKNSSILKISITTALLLGVILLIGFLFTNKASRTYAHTTDVHGWCSPSLFNVRSEGEDISPQGGVYYVSPGSNVQVVFLMKEYRGTWEKIDRAHVSSGDSISRNDPELSRDSYARYNSADDTWLASYSYTMPSQGEQTRTLWKWNAIHKTGSAFLLRGDGYHCGNPFDGFSSGTAEAKIVTRGVVQEPINAPDLAVELADPLPSVIAGPDYVQTYNHFDKVNIKYFTNYADSCTLSGPDGSSNVSVRNGQWTTVQGISKIEDDSSIKVSCTNASGSIEKSVDAVVNPGTDLKVNTTSISKGSSITLSWSTTPNGRFCGNIEVSKDGSAQPPIDNANKETNSSVTYTPPSSGNYKFTIKCTGKYAELDDSVNVTVSGSTSASLKVCSNEATTYTIQSNNTSESIENNSLFFGQSNGGSRTHSVNPLSGGTIYTVTYDNKSGKTETISINGNNIAGNSGSYTLYPGGSTEICITYTEEAQPPADPDPSGTFTCENGTATAKITWDAISGVTGYRVYKASAANHPNNYSLRTTTPLTSYTDTAGFGSPGSTFYYQVEAYNDTGNSNRTQVPNSSNNGNYEFVVPNCSVPTVDIKVNDSDNPSSVVQNSNVKVSWTSSNANACAIRTEKPNGTKPLLSSDKNNTNYQYQVTDVGQYKFTIECSNNNGNATDGPVNLDVTAITPNSPSVALECKANTSGDAPASPRNVVSWSASAISGESEWELRRSGGAAKFWSFTLTAGTISHTDTDLSYNSEYSYRVRYKLNGTWSDYSSHSGFKKATCDATIGVTSKIYGTSTPLSASWKIESRYKGEAWNTNNQNSSSHTARPETTPGTLYSVKDISASGYKLKQITANTTSAVVTGNAMSQTITPGTDLQFTLHWEVDNPDDPVISSATISCSNNEAQVSMSYSSSGATNYKVYKATSAQHSQNNYQTVQDSSSTSYTETGGFTEGQTYYYRVQAFNAGGESNTIQVRNTSTGFHEFTAPDCSPDPVSKPSAQVECINGPNASPRIKITWDSVSQAQAWKIIRSDNTEFNIQGNTTSYTDNNLNYGSSYKYKVRYNKNGIWSADSPQSDSVTATCDAVVKVNSNVATSYTINPEVGNQSVSSGQANTHTVQPDDNRDSYNISAQRPFGYNNANITFRINNGQWNNGTSGAIKPGQTLEFKLNYTQIPACSTNLKVNNSDGPIYVEPGTNFNLSWTLNNAASASKSASPAHNSWKGSINPPQTGSQNNITVNQTTTFTINCSSEGGDSSDSVKVNVVDGSTMNLQASKECPNGVPAQSRINLDWQPIVDAQNYKVYKSSTGGTPNQFVGTANNSDYKYTVPNSEYNKDLSFKVAAVIGSSEFSSNTVSRKATCDATISVTTNLSTGYRINPEISGKQSIGNGQTNSHTVRPIDSGRSYSINADSKPGYELTVRFKVNNGSWNNGVSGTIKPAQTLSFDLNYKNIVAQPGIDATSPRCEQVNIIITDNSEAEDRFILYRDTDSNFNNGKTEIAVIPSQTKGTTGAQYSYNDGVNVINNTTYYYHVIAQRTSDGMTSPHATDNVLVAVCPPNLDGTKMEVISVKKAGTGDIKPYEPNMRINNKDTLTLRINIINSQDAIARDLVNYLSISNNLKLIPNSVRLNGGQLTSREESKTNTLTTYRNPSSGDMGDMGQTTWTITFDALVDSDKEGKSAFDRIVSNGIIAYQYNGKTFNAPYKLGTLLIYLRPPVPTQFQEQLPDGL